MLIIIKLFKLAINIIARVIQHEFSYSIIRFMKSKRTPKLHYLAAIPDFCSDLKSKGK